MQEDLPPILLLIWVPRSPFLACMIAMRRICLHVVKCHSVSIFTNAQYATFRYVICYSFSSGLPTYSLSEPNSHKKNNEIREEFRDL
jgi:hypothetical protein